MPSFRYSGVAANGRSVAGTVEADSPRSARATLRERQVFATSVTELGAETSGAGTGRFGMRRRLRSGELAQALRQLATLLRAGVPLDEAVDALRRRRGGAALSEALEAVRTRIREGASLATAMADHPSIFPSIYTGMVEAGEASGALDAVLERIATHAEAQSRLRARLVGALTYPAFLTSAGLVIVIFLLAYVVPQVTRVFAERKQALPLPTKLLMASGDFLASYGLLLIPLAILAAVVLRRAWATPASRMQIETLLYRLPAIGSTMRDVAVARFAQTLATLVGGGLPLVESLRVARASSGSLVISETLAEAETAVFEGGSLAACLSRSPLFDPVLVDMVAVGERSGDLDGMLAHAAGAIEEQVRLRVDRMADLLGPATTLIMAGIVLFVMLAIMLPIFDMNQLVR